MLARNAACVLLNTAINASTMSDINTTTTRISTSVKARGAHDGRAALPRRLDFRADRQVCPTFVEILDFRFTARW
jgi:hypothetical protein